jgi:predicted permease
MEALGKRYIQTHPEQLGNDDKLEVIPTQQQITGDVRPALLILLAAVGLVLLIACANVANLLLAQALVRQKEIAIRSAIGAGRRRIVRQLLIESVLLALAGGGLGLGLGSLGVHALLALTPSSLTGVQEITGTPALDLRVAGFTVLLSVITGIVFGLVPTLQLSRADLTCFLNESSGRTGTGLRHYRTRGALVVVEVAMTVVLVCGALLLIRSFVALHRVEPGFNPGNLLTMRVALAGREYATPSAVDRLARQLVDHLNRIPGVQSAALSSSLPFGPIADMLFDIPGRPPIEGYKFTGDVLWCFVSPDYFKTLQVPLGFGRSFGDREPVHTVIINDAMARKFWPKQNPVGQSIIIGAGLGPDLDQGPTEIIGIVGDVHERLDAAPTATMYLLWSQVPVGGLTLLSQLYPASIAVRTKAGVAPLSVAKAVREELLGGDTKLPATKVQTMDQVMQDSMARANFNLILISIFAGIALLLAAVGIFGVVSHTVQQRTREIGIRMALGAQKHEVLAVVVNQGMILTVTGVGIGLAGALALTKFLSSLLYGVKPSDPLTFVVVSLLLSGVGLIACYLPARRATRVDPMVALRCE